MPEVHALTLKAVPTDLNTTPDGTAGAEIGLTNTGNTAETVALTPDMKIWYNTTNCRVA